MFWLLFGALLTHAEQPEIKKDIYVAPPTIHDEALREFQPYLNSLLVSSAQSNKHWVRRTHKAKKVNIHDKHTIESVMDTVCDYDKPLKCGSENMHWVLVTDIFVTPNFATVVVKMYDENTELIASASKSSYSVEKCKDQTTVTTIKSPGRPATEITEKKPDLCTIVNPKILSKDLKQVITILFASIHPA
tara:strand:+ start:1488 stop:2057 length:570 start_codon:yes stop_codon:yes gene_type:complete